MGCTESKDVVGKVRMAGPNPAISKNLFGHYVRKGEWEADIKAETDE